MSTYVYWQPYSSVKIKISQPARSVAGLHNFTNTAIPARTQDGLLVKQSLSKHMLSIYSLLDPISAGETWPEIREVCRLVGEREAWADNRIKVVTKGVWINAREMWKQDIFLCENETLQSNLLKISPFAYILSWTLWGIITPLFRWGNGSTGDSEGHTTSYAVDSHPGPSLCITTTSSLS